MDIAPFDTDNKHLMTEGEARAYMRLLACMMSELSFRLVMDRAIRSGKTAHSLALSDLDEYDQESLKREHPWIFGVRSVLADLDKVSLDLYRDPNYFDPIVFLNWMFIVERIELLRAYSLARGYRFPKPDHRWASGWNESGLRRSDEETRPMKVCGACGATYMNLSWLEYPIITRNSMGYTSVVNSPGPIYDEQIFDQSGNLVAQSRALDESGAGVRSGTTDADPADCSDR
jgi:hypothetical protein